MLYSKKLRSLNTPQFGSRLQLKKTFSNCGTPIKLTSLDHLSPKRSRTWPASNDINSNHITSDVFTSLLFLDCSRTGLLTEIALYTLFNWLIALTTKHNQRNSANKEKSQVDWTTRGISAYDVKNLINPMGALNTINFHLETFFTDLTSLRDRRVL